MNASLPIGIHLPLAVVFGCGLVTAAMGCGDRGEGESSQDTSGLASQGDGDGDGSGDGDGDGSGDGDGDGDGEIIYDVGMGDTSEEEKEGCEGIDFLFVIDKSSSMSEKQANLVASFPGFVSAIEAKAAELDAADFHILATHTDTIGIYNIDQNCMWDCPTDEGVCELDGSACSFVNDYSCLDTCREDIENTCDNGKSCHELLPECGACGCTLGAGRVDDKDGGDCNVEGEKSYLQDGQSDLEGTFACVAEVGISGARERQADAVVNALSPDLTEAGGCNEGFVRNDSILVVTLITDEEDGEVAGNGVPEWAVGSSGTPAEWKQKVLEAKNGNPEGVVMLGLIGDRDQPDPVCQCELNDMDCEGGQAEPSPLLREFVTSFPQHVVGSVCEPNYDDFFDQAIDLINDTCENYTPPAG